MAQQPNTLYKKSKPITYAVSGAGVTRKYVPTFGSISDDATVTLWDTYGLPTSEYVGDPWDITKTTAHGNVIITLTDDLVSTYWAADES